MGTCMCKWGGFAPDCATKDCGPYAMFLKGECKCMYGKKNEGKDCANCAKNCGSGATCEAGGMIWRKLNFCIINEEGWEASLNISVTQLHLQLEFLLHRNSNPICDS